MSAERSSADGRQMTSAPCTAWMRRQLGVVAVEADDHADPAELGVAHRRPCRPGVTHPPPPTRLGAERVRLAVDAEHLTRRVDEDRGVVDDVGGRPALVGADDEVHAELGRDVDAAGR